MGGAQRANRQRRQQAQAARSVAQARNAADDRRKIIVAVVAVVVVAVAIIGTVIWTNSSKNSTAQQTINPAPGTSATKPVSGVVEKRDGVVVTVGKPGAKASIDFYADFLCPICGEFEQVYGKDIENAVNSGQLLVRYHMIPLLTESSDPPGYSLDSANAALAAADDGKFTAFHDALYGSQPKEGERGYDKAQLIKLGQDLGIKDPAFAMKINAGTYNAQLNADLAQSEQNQNLWSDNGRGGRGFGTPTIAVGGKSIDRTDQNWLQKVLAGQS